ncbi:hypothetical protein FPQ18DRAFT_383474 [Pyronema domesticum]|uniref:Uncharacterized protein n=1 Tax=Pyronema omphalodes (strain CBS 100304) TaxID=1076935 RepID=U4LCT3_PYROM|nr:hypothetical protein FPQ18DRAFT_383474 [Pyronema domesticum]CCX29904.1 Protein of unknown function [Pyronema omphalodes CBS 100304]
MTPPPATSSRPTTTSSSPHPSPKPAPDYPHSHLHFSQLSTANTTLIAKNQELQALTTQLVSENKNLLKEFERLMKDNESLRTMANEYKEFYDEVDSLVLARKSVGDRFRDLFSGMAGKSVQ